jgi:hypothetical protein
LTSHSDHSKIALQAGSMKHLLIALMALIAMLAPSYAAEKQAPLAQKLGEQKMTQGLSTDTPSGAPGLVYQGGVAGYSGPTRESDNRIGTSLQANADRQSATQKAVEDLRKAVVEQKNGADVQKALRQSQTAIQTQFEETTRVLQQQQQNSNPSPSAR